MAKPNATKAVAASEAAAQLATGPAPVSADPVIALAHDATRDVIVARTADGKAHEIPTLAYIDRYAAEFLKAMNGSDNDG
jgi:hypothetical protein